jgi:hypothetical protein
MNNNDRGTSKKRKFNDVSNDLKRDEDILFG